MRRTYATQLVLLLATIVLLSCGVFSEAAEKKDKSNWPTELPKRKHDPSELSERDINRIMDRVKQVNPDKARKLATLRKEDPENFEAELKEMVRAGFREKTRPQEELGAEEKFRPRGWDKDPKARKLINMRYDRHLEWLTENYPQEASRLSKLKENQPDVYAEQMESSLRKYGGIALVAKNSPELAQVLKEDADLQEQADKLAEKIRTTSDQNEKEELVEQLEEVVVRRYDLRVRKKQIRHEQLLKQIEELEEKAKQSKADIKKSKKRKFKREYIQSTVDKLIGAEEKPKRG